MSARPESCPETAHRHRRAAAARGRHRRAPQAVLVACAIVACTGALSAGGAAANADATTGPQTPDQPVAWVPHTYSGEAGNCDTPDNPAPCTRVQFDWIEVTAAGSEAAVAALNEPTRAWLRRSVFEDDGGDPEEISAAFQRTHDELRDEFSDYVLPWWVERTVTVERNATGVFALSMYENLFTGGAHGAHNLHYRNHRPDSGAPIALTDILMEGGLEQLTAIAERIFREQMEIPDGVSLADAGFWFENDTFALNDNFLIGADGLLFRYNEYEIAAYVFGATELRVPYDAFADLLRPDAAIR